MGKLGDIQQHIQHIKAHEGSSFIYDEAAIQDAFQKRGGQKSTFIIKTLSIFGGIMASIAFLGFLLILELYNSESAALLVGLGLIIISIVLVKKYDKLIIDTFGISLFVLGLILFIIALFAFDINEDVVTLFVMAIALCVLFLVPAQIISFFSFLMISGGGLFLIISNDMYALVHLYINLHAFALTYVFLNESSVYTSGPNFIKLYDPLRTALIFSLLLGLIPTIKNDLVFMSTDHFWTSSLVLILILLFVVDHLLKKGKVVSRKTWFWVYVLSTLTLLPALFAPTILGALLIILVSFKVNYRTGLYVGIVALIYFVGQYYYDLSFTLLTKSIILFSSGIVFLVFYVFLTKKLTSHEKV